MIAAALRAARIRRFVSHALVWTGLLLFAGGTADASKYILYIHGRSMQTWPPAAYQGASGEWTHMPLAFDGSARLGNSTVRTQVKNAVQTYCSGGNQCQISCYSAGCARALVALDDLAAQGTPATGVLWTMAVGSAAGGSELASTSTNKGIRLIAKLFNAEGVQPLAMVDYDLGPGNMRGTWGSIQNRAPSAVYHLAGSGNICIRVKITEIVGTIASLLGMPVVGTVIKVFGSLFGSPKVKFCGNSQFPGGKGDGVVPVHSAAGYADTQAHSNHADGSAKYTFRAYEQVPLFSNDHRSLLAPYVQFASVRTAVPKTASCAAMPPATSEATASIVYEDADGALSYENQPLHLLTLCGNDVWNGVDQPLYATCAGTDGCCENFSTGNSGACTCGETLCAQSAHESRSWYTGSNCSGTEYSVGLAPVSWDGTGMIGITTAGVTVRSTRDNTGTCRNTVRKRTWRGSCPEYEAYAHSLASAKRVYRTGIPSYGSDLGTLGNWNGWVVATINHNANCP